MSPRSGFEASGTGVEHGTEVIREYTRLESVRVNTGEEPAAPTRFSCEPEALAATQSD